MEYVFKFKHGQRSRGQDWDSGNSGLEGEGCGATRKGMSWKFSLIEGTSLNANSCHVPFSLSTRNQHECGGKATAAGEERALSRLT